jgi:hypothetical protein
LRLVPLADGGSPRALAQGSPSERGPEWEDKEVVVDGNLVSSRKPAEIPALQSGDDLFVRSHARASSPNRVTPTLHPPQRGLASNRRTVAKSTLSANVRDADECQSRARPRLRAALAAIPNDRQPKPTGRLPNPSSLAPIRILVRALAPRELRQHQLGVVEGHSRQQSQSRHARRK